MNSPVSEVRVLPRSAKVSLAAGRGLPPRIPTTPLTDRDGAAALAEPFKLQMNRTQSRIECVRTRAGQNVVSHPVNEKYTGL